MVNLLNYKHVIWDWNGTLINDRQANITILNKLLSKRSLQPVTEKEYLDFFGFPVVEVYRKLGFDFEKESFNNISNEYFSHYEQMEPGCALHGETMSLVHFLDQAGIPQSILSAYYHERLIKAVKMKGVDHFFSTILGNMDSDSVGKIDYGIKHLAELNLSGSDVLIIGDTLHDRETAEVLGIDCLLFSGGHQSVNRLKQGGVPLFSAASQLLSENELNTTSRA